MSANTRPEVLRQRPLSGFCVCFHSDPIAVPDVQKRAF